MGKPADQEVDAAMTGSIPAGTETNQSSVPPEQPETVPVTEPAAEAATPASPAEEAPKAE